jgi:hypothetical protein
MKKLLPLGLLVILLTFGAQANPFRIDILDLYKYLSTAIKYPEKAISKDLQGNSIVLFTVTNGKLGNISIDKELGSGCDVEVVNSIMAYEHFNGLKNGKYALATNFRLNGSTSKIENELDKVPEGYIPLKLTITAMAAATAMNVNVVGYGNNQAFQFLPTSKVVLRGTDQAVKPLVYLDSVAVDYDELKLMKPSTIQSIHIYKGADAIALYGPSAINGVIVLVTKREHIAPVKKESPIEEKN